jgi:hypothetical protein
MNGRRRALGRLRLGVGLLLLTACTTAGPGSSPASSGTSESSSAPASTDAASTGAVSTGESGAYAVEIAFAREEVHDRFGHPLEDIDLVLVERVIWPDASLGCPRPERTYDPEDIAGYRIVLRWDSVEFSYHGADGSLPVHCMFLDG